MRRIVLSLVVALAAAATVAAQQKPTIAITEVIARNVDPAEAELVYEYVVDRINRSAVYEVVERAALDKALAELDISLSEMIDEATATRIGRMAEAQYILVSSLLKVGSDYHLSMRVVAVETAKVFQTSVKRASDLREVPALADEAVASLLQDYRRTDPAGTREADRRRGLGPLSLQAGGAVGIPLGAYRQVLGPGYGFTAGLDCGILNLGPGTLYAGFKSGATVQSTIAESVAYEFTLIRIPLALSLGWRSQPVGRLHFFGELAGGAAISIFAFADEAPQRPTTTAIKLSLYPGAGIGVRLTDAVSLRAVATGDVVLYGAVPENTADGYAYFGLGAGLGIEVRL